MTNRINKLRRLMNQYGMKNLFVFNQIDRFYLSNFKSSKGILYISEKKCDLILNSKYLVDAKEKCCGIDVVKEELDLKTTIKKLIERDKIDEINLCGDDISAKDFQILNEGLEIEINLYKNLVEVIRSIKDEREIELISKACEYTDIIYDSAINYIRKNERISELELSRFIEIEIINRGLKNSFEIIVASGVNGAKPHHKPTDKVIEVGEFVTIDFGVIYRGYRSDMTRTFSYGEPKSEELVYIYNIVKEAEQKGVDNLKSGMKCNEIDSECREYIEKFGYGKNFVHGTGHGVGLEGHECQIINNNSSEVVNCGAVITIEPGIYIEGLGGVRIEDTVVVRNDKSEVLTRSIKDLIIV